MSVTSLIALDQAAEDGRSRSKPEVRALNQAVRAAIDAVVAHAYGLTRDQYAHVLRTFSRSSYKDAPRQCLAAVDELRQLGLQAFTQRHDPYWHIPLDGNRPQPMIDLPIRVTISGHRPTTHPSTRERLR